MALNITEETWVKDQVAITDKEKAYQVVMDEAMAAHIAQEKLNAIALKNVDDSFLSRINTARVALTDARIGISEVIKDV